MPVKSYLVYHKAGQKDVLSRRLNALRGCEVIPSQNKDVIVLVTDTYSKEEEKMLETELAALNNINHLSLVSGFAAELNQSKA